MTELRLFTLPLAFSTKNECGGEGENVFIQFEPQPVIFATRLLLLAYTCGA